MSPPGAEEPLANPRTKSHQMCSDIRLNPPTEAEKREWEERRKQAQARYNKSRWRDTGKKPYHRQPPKGEKKRSRESGTTLIPRGSLELGVTKGLKGLKIVRVAEYEEQPTQEEATPTPAEESSAEEGETRAAPEFPLKVLDDKSTVREVLRQLVKGGRKYVIAFGHVLFLNKRPKDTNPPEVTTLCWQSHEVISKGIDPYRCVFRPSLDEAYVEPFQKALIEKGFEKVKEERDVLKVYCEVDWKMNELKLIKDGKDNWKVARSRPKQVTHNTCTVALGHVPDLRIRSKQKTNPFETHPENAIRLADQLTVTVENGCASIVHQTPKPYARMVRFLVCYRLVEKYRRENMSVSIRYVIPTGKHRDSSPSEVEITMKATGAVELDELVKALEVSEELCKTVGFVEAETEASSQAGESGEQAEIGEKEG